MSPNRNYQNGAARERRIIKKLEQEGWFCVRSAGSHGIVDIVAMRLVYQPAGDFTTAFEGVRVRLIQSKVTGYLTPEERLEKLALEKRLGIEVEVI